MVLLRAYGFDHMTAYLRRLSAGPLFMMTITESLHIIRIIQIIGD